MSAYELRQKRLQQRLQQLDPEKRKKAEAILKKTAEQKAAAAEVRKAQAAAKAKAAAEAKAKAEAAAKAKALAEAKAKAEAAVKAKAAAEAKARAEAAAAAKVEPVEEAKPTLEYSFIGCYKDSEDRILPNHAPGGASVKWNKCRNIARDAGSRYFGLQWREGDENPLTGECWHGNAIKRKDPATNCAVHGNRQMGGSWSIAMYDRAPNGSASAAPVPAPVPAPAGGMTSVQMCCPWKKADCPRAGGKLTCNEYWDCYSSKKHCPCAGEEWYNRCGYKGSQKGLNYDKNL
jgi:hypothetical protein